MPLPLSATSEGGFEAYQLDLPYGMGDCRTFMDIPPLVHLEDGSTCINPDFECIRRFSIVAVGRQPGVVNGGLVEQVSVSPSETVEMQLTAEREENGLGHILINELFLFTNPANAIDGLLVEMKTLQGDRIYTSGPIPAVSMFGNAHLNVCLPCPIMLYPNQTLIFKVTNRSLNPPVDIAFQIVARGKKFLPYHNMELAKEIERCWSMVQTIPFWLGFDDHAGNSFGEVLMPAGAGTQAFGQMTTPGGGHFELKYPRVQIVPDFAIGMTADEIDVEVTYGRVGKRPMDGPISLGGHYATETKTIAGFIGDTFRSASAEECPPATQIYRGNTRILHEFTNRNTAGGSSLIRLIYAGCMHYVSACPPQEDLDLVRRYGSGDARRLKKAQDEGDRVYLSFFDENPLYAEEQDDSCAPSAQEVVEQGISGAQEAVEVQIVSMHRPNKVYHGPGSVGALPWNYSWGMDQSGETHLVIRDANTGAYVRPANADELAPFKPWLDQINGHSGLGGLGDAGRSPRGEWEAL